MGYWTKKEATRSARERARQTNYATTFYVVRSDEHDGKYHVATALDLDTYFASVRAQDILSAH